MKRFTVIGLGNFGSTVARSLFSSGQDVIVVDLDEATVDAMATAVTRAAVGDGRDPAMLERVGVKDSDAAIVSTGDDLAASVLIILALRDIGLKEIYAKVNSMEHARVLRKIGATESIFPERDSANNLAARLVHGDSLLKFMKLGTDFAVQEMVVPDAWLGKTIREIDVRRQYRLNIVAVHDVLTDYINAAPDPEAVLKDSDTLLLAGDNEDLERVATLK